MESSIIMNLENMREKDGIYLCLCVTTVNFHSQQIQMCIHCSIIIIKNTSNNLEDREERQKNSAADAIAPVNKISKNYLYRTKNR